MEGWLTDSVASAKLLGWSVRPLPFHCTTLAMSCPAPRLAASVLGLLYSNRGVRSLRHGYAAPPPFSLREKGGFWAVLFHTGDHHPKGSPFPKGAHEARALWAKQREVSPSKPRRGGGARTRPKGVRSPGIPGQRSAGRYEDPSEAGSTTSELASSGGRKAAGAPRTRSKAKSAGAEHRAAKGGTVRRRGTTIANCGMLSAKLTEGSQRAAGAKTGLPPTKNAPMRLTAPGRFSARPRFPAARI